LPTRTYLYSVWSGGLGNFEANQLPSCQLHQLKASLREVIAQDFSWTPNNRIRRLPLAGRVGSDFWDYAIALVADGLPRKTPLRFWMDTLCIPVGEQHAVWRARSINNMARIYAQATSMLVLDDSLSRSFPASDNELEVDARILCSPWMSRAWTLQEVALGLNRYVQVSGGRLISSIQSKDINMYRSTAIRNDGEAIETSEPEGYYHDLYAFYRNIQTSTISLPIQRAKSASSALEEWVLELIRFTKIWNSLSGRTTTMPEDVHIIVATILGFSPKELLDLPRETRMKSILRAHPILPLALLSETGPRLNGHTDLDSWVLNHPRNGSHLDICYGGMVVKPDGNLWIPLGRSQCELVDPAFDGCELHAYKVHEPLGDGLWVFLSDTRCRIWVECVSWPDSELRTSHTSPTILLLTRVTRASGLESALAHEFLPQGVRLEVIIDQNGEFLCKYGGPVRIKMAGRTISFATIELNETPLEITRIQLDSTLYLASGETD
jgi:hypothetical protein